MTVHKDNLNRKRFLQLFAGILMSCCGGSSYAFGIFSNKIKESANFSQSDMTMITTAGFVFQGFTMPAGFLYDYYGPRSVLACALLLCCGGFTLLAMIFDGVIPSNVYTVSVANAMTNMGSSFTDGGSLMTNLLNFPTNSGEVLIIQKTFFGLGATFLSLIFDGFFGASQNYIGFAVFVCLLMFVAMGLGTAVTTLPPYMRTAREAKRVEELTDPAEREADRLSQEQSFEDFHNPHLADQRRLNLGVTILFITLSFFSTFSLVSTYIEISQQVLTALTALACVCMASFAVLVVPVRIPKFFDYELLPDLHAPKSSPDHVEGGQAADHDETQSLLRGKLGKGSTETEPKNDSQILITNPAATTLANSETFWTNARRPLLWCFFFTAFTMMGSIAVIYSNFTQIIIAANNGLYDAKANSLSVALAGIGSAVGRVVVGYIDIYIQRKNALLRENQSHSSLSAEAIGNITSPQPCVEPPTPVHHRLFSSPSFCLPIPPALAAVSIFLFTVIPVSAYPPVLCCFGFGAGSFFALTALTVKEIFSVEVGKHYNFILSAGMLSSVLLNRLMFGEWYDSEAQTHRAGDGISCEGYQCFSNSMYVLAGLSCLAVITSSYITYAWWNKRKQF